MQSYNILQSVRHYSNTRIACKIILKLFCSQVHKLQIDSVTQNGVFIIIILFLSVTLNCKCRVDRFYYFSFPDSYMHATSGRASSWVWQQGLCPLRSLNRQFRLNGVSNLTGFEYFNHWPISVPNVRDCRSIP